MATVPEEVAPETGTHRKPPFLRRVRIRNYKSIKFCDVTLEPLTVLVGRNGSGKSNFVDALAFLRHMFFDGLSDAVRRHGGHGRVLTKAAEEDIVSLDIECETQGVDSLSLAIRYRVDIELPSQHAPRVAHETLQVSYPQGGIVMEFERIGRRIVSLTGVAGEVIPALEDARLLLRQIPSVYLAHFFMNLWGICNYNFRPDVIRQPQTPEPDQLLETTGRNLASVLGSMERSQPASLERLKNYFAAIVGGVHLVGVQSLGQYETISFQVSRSHGAMDFDAASMSDGTLRILAALAAAFQPNEPLYASGLVAIEEPETSLHPAAMHALVDALDEATGRTQILLTTHSTELLDNPTIRPENVRVVEMVNGETVITPVDDASVQIVKEGLNTLGGLQRGDQLELNRRVVRELAGQAGNPQ